MLHERNSHALLIRVQRVWIKVLMMRWTRAIGAILVAASLGLGAAIYLSTLSSDSTIPSAIRLQVAGNNVEPKGLARQSPASTNEPGEQEHGSQKPNPGTEEDGPSQVARPAPPPPPCPAGEDTETGDDPDDDCDDEDDADDLDEEDDGD